MPVQKIPKSLSEALDKKYQYRSTPINLLSTLLEMVGGGDPGEEAMGMVNPLVGKGLSGALGTIKAYHGSPYKFKKFVDEAIGTGEGAQAFGHGHYFSDVPEFAEEYGKKLWKQSGIDNPLLTYGEEIAKTKNPYLYKTHIFPGKKPSQYDLLEWDKKVTPQQVNKVVKQMRKEGLDKGTIDYIKHKGREYNGDEFYEFFERHIWDNNTRWGQEGASKFLKRAGIDGNKYPSGTLSGIKDSPYSNYVIFDPKDILIKKRKPIK